MQFIARKKMERSPEIMLKIFEHFIKQPFAYNPRATPDSEINKCCPPDLSVEDPIVKWHITLFLQEFVLIESLYVFPPDRTGTDFLTWGGQCLFEELKRIHEKKKEGMP
jgi:hypothetical protein